MGISFWMAYLPRMTLDQVKPAHHPPNDDENGDPTEWPMEL
jgi:hypothetical protein